MAQISYGGRALGLQGDVLPEAPLVRMHTVDVDALLAEDAAREAAGIKGPYRYGFNHAVDLNTENSGIWHTLRDGDRVWRISIECPGAITTNFQFHDYVVPEGARVFVYNTAGLQLGAYTADSNPGHTSMGVQQIPGDRITIEYHEPVAVAGQGRLMIGQVTHGYRDPFNFARDLGDSGSCNINVICPEGLGWEDEVRSVALIDAGGGYCTGTMINNCAQDSTPYFLTANHCLGGGVDNWVFRWNWNSPTCDPTEDAPQDQTIAGSTLLVNSAGTDVALLELNSIPPEEYAVHYAGWDHGQDPAETMTGIHHPRGDIKKISHSDGPAITGTMSGADCWQVQLWAAGTTEPGSSGSGLWNQDHRLVGQLFGGEAACGNSVNDFYGKLVTSWPLLEEYLGDCSDTLDGWDLGETVFIPDTNDAAVTSIANIPTLLCGTDSIIPQISLKNNSNVVMTMMDVIYGLVGGIEDTLNWTGTLQPDQTVILFLPTIYVPNGEQILNVSASMPNGIPDANLDNDTWSFAFTVVYPSETVILALTPDNYGADITWEITSSIGTVLYEGGPYTNNNSGVTDSLMFCLTDTCYTFTIYDEFGDGICCDAGEGHYEIFGLYGNEYASSDGQYTFQNSNSFCVSLVGINEPTDAGTLNLYPNPTTGNLTVQLAGMEGRTELTLLDNTGRIVEQRIVNGTKQLTLDLSTLAEGLYALQAQHAGGRVVQQVMVVR
ncbi:MAG: T9SS type A sorting domain-containing protein [Flavobacteriales bacterium]|nr:T9SS type A sorting domain-containing protein [Flavobacteriales bacterium]